MAVKLEICVDSIRSALNAYEAGASRLELCSSLMEGGLTPSLGLLRCVKSQVEIPVYVLIRPRGGDFCYSAEEVEVMKQDILISKENRADGIVLGALTSLGDIDKETCKILIDEAYPLPVTFHRAFDLSSNPIAALESVIDLGCQRILTSGQASDVSQGLQLIKVLKEKASDAVIIMPGGGVNENNIEDLLKIKGIKEIHSSASTFIISPMAHNSSNITMGRESCETKWKECDISKVKGLLSVIKKFSS